MPVTIATCVVFAGIVLSRSTALAASFTFSLLPENGQVAGPPDSAVGWGYSITNPSPTDWLVTSGLNADSFLFGTPTALFDFPDVAPAHTITVPYVAGTPAGLYEFTWDAAAPHDFTNFGRFTLSAEWWSGNPFNGGTFIQFAPDVTQRYSATVTEPIPEPSTFVPVVVCAILFVRHRLRRCT